MRIGSLLGIRQGYKLLANWYQIYRQPEITIREIRDDFDKSQIFLLAITAFGPLGAYVIARILWDLIKYREIIWLTGKGFELTMVIQGIILSYFFYWIIRIYREDKNGKS